MVRQVSILLALAVALAGCTDPTPRQLAPDGRPLPQVYKIRPAEAGKIQFRMLDSINALRGAAAAPPVQLDPQLNAAAATHSRDMSVQNRPWHFGSDGS
ncbi:MAG: CAP domain-containing protein, partial [Pseudooceanicola sp.]|nr:CAP domain-containing protein [Pseudooceanicola sp.]